MVLTALLAACSMEGVDGLDDEEASASAADAASADDARLAADCAALVRDVGASLQDYVDQFAVEGDDGGGQIGAVAPSVEELQSAGRAFRERQEELGCPDRTFQADLAQQLDLLVAQGPLARAVLPVIRDALIPSAGPAVTVTVEPGDDLAGAVHGAGPGAVVELAGGRYVLDEPLVLLRSTDLRGAGSETTEVVSSAAGVAVAFLGEGSFRAEGVAVVHEGDEPASALVLSSGGYELVDVAVSGGVVDDTGVGWGLVVGGGEADGDASTTQRLDRVTAADNGAGGVVVLGERAPVVRGFVGRDNVGCALCWFGSGGGVVDGAVLTGNEIGLTLAGTGDPALSDLEVNDNAVLGILVEDGSRATLRTAVVETPDGAVASLGIRGDATPTLEDVTVRGGDEVALLVEGSAAPTLREVRLGGAPVGLLARDEAAPTLGGVDVTDVTEVSLVHAGSSGGTVVDVDCAAGVPGIVLIDDTTVEVGDVSCEVLDQRG